MGSQPIPRPAAGEFDPHYAMYIDPVAHEDLLTQLDREARSTAKFLATIPESRAGYRYAVGKWSIREVIGHLADAERIFSYRALRISRGDTTPLASFDENLYAKAARFDQRTLSDVGAEFAAVRTSTLALFRQLNQEEFARVGTASGKPISVRALAFIILGHERHHLNVIKDRYLEGGK